MKWMTLTAAMLVCFGAVDNADAGLFDCFKKKNNCCQPTCCEPVVVYEAAPCCQPAPCCEPAPCCRPKKKCFLSGLFGGCHKKNNCCQPAPCCEPAPCCQPAPCCESAPCCEPAPCCRPKKKCFLSGLFGGCHKKNNCCNTCYAPAPSCGCGGSYAPVYGGHAAPAPAPAPAH